jgi:hypothetical protein
MNLKYSALIAALASATTSAFTAPTAFHRSTALSGLADDDIESAIKRSVSQLFPAHLENAEEVIGLIGVIDIDAIMSNLRR